jgi:signal transduction histidine kinase/ActR/RegA family two-component response regulator
VEGGRPYDVEYRVVGADDRVRWIESKGRVEYEGDRAVRIIGISMAVSRRKEAEIARLADAEEANRMKDQFLATLSHELRTPLHAILGWIQVLEGDGSASVRHRHAMEVVKRNAKLQAQLIEDILDVSRIMSGKLAVETQPLNMAALVDATLSAVLPMAAVKQIQIACEMPDTMPAIEGDARRLQQVLGNVLSNAIKFTPEQGTVRVTCAIDGQTLSIAIADSGAGIAPELLPYIFDRFRQGDSRSTRRHGGLGLGLAIAQHLVERHGGSIHAQSDGVGQGTTFTIRLPIPAHVTPVDTRRASAGPVTLDLSGCNVLVVDDQEDSRELLVHLLHQCGARVMHCATAHTALAALSSTRFDLLVADIAMPEIDGYDLIERVRGLDGSPGSVPAIAVTAYAHTQDRANMLAAGYNEYCPKPLDSAEFMSVIGRLLSAEQGASPSSA